MNWRFSQFRARSKGARAAVVAADGTLAVAVVQRHAERARLVHCCVESAVGGFGDPALRRLQREFGLDRVAVSAVLSHEDYRLAQIQAPEVPEEEMRAAARWRMQDAFDFPIDDASVDVFDVPPRRGGHGRRLLFAIASRNDAPQRIASALSGSLRGFDVIDIPELCLRNLSALLPQDANGVALILLRERSAQLILTRQKMLYVTRQLELDVQGGAIDAQALALELQRSLDYYDTQFDAAAIGDVVIAPGDATAERLAEELSALTGLRANALLLPQVMDLPAAMPVPSGWLSQVAIGAALRE